jgi:hypothetical protein
MRKLLLGSLLLLLTACSTVTLTPKGQAKYETSPTYQERLPFFLAGIIGGNVRQAKHPTNPNSKHIYGFILIDCDFIDLFTTNCACLVR